MPKKYKLSKEMDMGVFYIEQDVADLEELVADKKVSFEEIVAMLRDISDKLKFLQNDGGNIVDEKSVVGVTE